MQQQQPQGWRDDAGIGAGDRQLYRGAVLTLAYVAMGVVIGIVFLTAADKVVPDALVALGSTALGALAGLLAPISKSAPKNE